MSPPRKWRFTADGHVYIIRGDGTGTSLLPLEQLYDNADRVVSRAENDGRIVILDPDGRPLLLIAACEDVEEEP